MPSVDQKIVSIIKEIVKEKYALNPEDGMIMIEIPKDSSNGDYSSNVAMRLTKILKRNPSDIANELKDELLKRCDEIDSIDIAGPGFINFWIKKSVLADTINTVLNMGNDYGCSKAGKGVKLLDEYVSANPTGPLHCGHARGAVWGDSCVKILNKAGWQATREYYINDAGAQMLNLGKSVLARYRELFGLDFELPEDGYHGPDIIEIAKEIKQQDGDKWLKLSEDEAIIEFRELGYAKELARIKEDLKYYGCEFDSWVSERWIVEQGMVDDAIKKMNEMNLLYENDGAIWFKATQYGDDKDRVLKKSDGYYTYMTPDIANHIYKYQRGYEILVNIWGADHHGYVPRMKAAMEALGYPRDNLQVDICQMVRMVENGVEVKMSKRTGNAITLRELIDDIGVDCTRFSFLSKALDTHMEFDLGFARNKGIDNPVYYVQYAYARICSLLKNQQIKQLKTYDLLTEEKETELLKIIASFTEIVADAAETRMPNKICNYVIKLAQSFHSFYGKCKIVDKNNVELSNQRLALTKATQITLKNALDLLGVSAPEHMEKIEETKEKKEEIVLTDEEVFNDNKKRFIIKNDFFELFPKSKIAIAVCKGINNKIVDANKYQPQLLKAQEDCLKYLPNPELSNNSVISVWRDAFSKFKTKKGARSSIEALLKRAYKKTGINTINPLVDIYNSISLTYALPCGGEDIDKFAGSLLLTKANGNESFITYGSNESEPPLAGEICYKDNEGCVCRCWNWREAVRTCLSENTTNAFMIIECVDPNRFDDLNNAINDLAKQIKDNLGGEVRVEILDCNNKSAIIE